MAVKSQDEYKIKYTHNEDGYWAYLEGYPNTIRYGANKRDAFTNLMLMLHEREE